MTKTKWMSHVSKIRRENPHLTYKEVLRLASKSFIRTGGQKGAGIINSLINMIPSSDATGRPRYPGEKHAILKLGGIKTGIANYAGPGTHILERTRRGDPPRTYTDGVANIHDIDFSLSGGDPKKIRIADQRMISKLQSGKNKDSIFNLKQGEWAIRSKVALEKLGVLPKGSFGISAGKYKEMSPGDIAMLKNRRAELVQKGYGRRVPRMSSGLPLYYPVVRALPDPHPRKKTRPYKLQ